MSGIALRKGIELMESKLMQVDQLDIPVKEKIIGSMYVRELTIPKDTILTSRVYKRGYVDIMVSGDITITDTNGVYRLTGANTLEGPAGRKRAGYAHEDTQWITIHDMVDIKDSPLEDISFISIDEYREHESTLSKASFLEFLESTGLEADTVEDQSTYEPYEPIEGPFTIGLSPIHGQGVFSDACFTAGQIIGPAVAEGKKTQLGRYVNHGAYPNTIYSGDNLMAVRAIDRGQEITVNYSESARLLK